MEAVRVGISGGFIAWMRTLGPGSAGQEQYQARYSREICSDLNTVFIQKGTPN